MNLSRMYQLDYTGKEIPQHVMIQIAGIENDRMSAESAASVAVAEYFLDMIEYRGKQVIRELGRSGASAQVTQNVAKYVKHIHSSCRDEIESRFVRPMLSDQEVSEILFDDLLEKELGKIAKGIEVSNRDLEKAVENVNATLRIMAQIQQEREKDRSANDRARDSFGKKFGLSIADTLRRAW